MKGKYTERGYVAKDDAETSTPPYVWALVATVLGVFAVTAVRVLEARGLSACLARLCATTAVSCARSWPVSRTLHTERWRN